MIRRCVHLDAIVKKGKKLCEKEIRVEYRGENHETQTSLINKNKYDKLTCLHCIWFYFSLSYASFVYRLNNTIIKYTKNSMYYFF